MAHALEMDYVPQGNLCPFRSSQISPDGISMIQEGSGQGTTFKTMTEPQDMIKKLSLRWHKVQLPVDLEPHYMFIVIHLQTKT